MSVKSAFVFVTACLACAPVVQAGVVSPIQSSARPLGLKPVGPVMMAGSDARSAKFMTSDFKPIADTAKSVLKEGKDNRPSGTLTLGLNDHPLKLEHDYDVRAVFIGEGASYRNSFGFFTTPYDPKVGVKGTDAQLIFPDSSSSASYLSSGTGIRSATEPLLPGDFVELGRIKSGTQINPFLIAQGATGGTNVYTPFASKNPDGKEHFAVVSVVALKDSPYLILGIEDLYGGGDNDFNDLVVVLDVGVANARAISGAGVPAPAAVWAGLAVAGWFGWSRRRRSTSEVVNSSAAA
jgi:hypothetical protein